MKKRFLSVVLGLLLALSFVSSAFAASYHENDIEKYIIGQLSNAKIPGGEVSIVTSGKEVYSASYGDVPETNSDLKIGSLSRIFTSISILQLMDSNKFTLDTNISELIPGEVGTSDVTVDELLRQTSGYTSTQKMESGSIPAPLGKKGEYQDARINYAILGKIVEEVSEESYADYIKKNIIEPLQLDSTYTSDEISGKDVVSGHDNLFGLPIVRKAVEKDDKEWDAVPATGIISDAKDMGSVLSMFLAAGGKTLSYDQIEKVYSDGTDCGNTIFNTEGTSSLGWIKTKVGKQDVYYVSGAIDGYISSAFLVPGQDIGITMLFDTSDVISGNDVIEELMSNVVRLAVGEKARTIDSKAVMLPHIEFDIVYFIAFLAALIPFILMSWWYRSTRNKGIGVVRTIVDAVVHIGLPIVIYNCVPLIIESVLDDSLGSWFMIKKFLPECYYITILLMAVLFIGIPVKVVAALIAIKKGPFDEDELYSDEDNAQSTIKEDDESEENSEENTVEKTQENISDIETSNIEEQAVNDTTEEKDVERDVEKETNSDKEESVKAEDDIVQEVAATVEEKAEEDVEVPAKDTDKKAVQTKSKKTKKEKKRAVKKEENEPEEVSEEVVKEFKSRNKKKQKTEEYGSSFEREAVKALESDEEADANGETDDALSDIKSDSKMQTAVPKIKKKYHHQKGMPVKIVVEPDDELDN